MRNRLPVIFTLCLLGTILLTGCVAPPPEETPEAERAAAKQSVKKANDAAAESKKQVDEGNAVLDGK